ncbi:MAG: GAF domain-containing protein [Bacteroidota bacterium]|nr:GAF domain-containing protein [Bacteroidota bacterium]
MEEIIIDANISKEKRYESLWPQISSLIDGEKNLIANMANIAAALHQTFGWWWIGFYLVDKETNDLVLGPFQGPIACTRIAKGKGVCGIAWKQAQTIIVPDVDTFPGHIACSTASKSEIVLPLILAGEVLAVLDVDSEHLNYFDETDSKWLQKVVDLLTKNQPWKL